MSKFLYGYYRQSRKSSRSLSCAMFISETSTEPSEAKWVRLLADRDLGLQVTYATLSLLSYLAADVPSVFREADYYPVLSRSRRLLQSSEAAGIIEALTRYREDLDIRILEVQLLRGNTADTTSLPVMRRSLQVTNDLLAAFQCMRRKRYRALGYLLACGHSRYGGSCMHGCYTKLLTLTADNYGDPWTHT